MDAVISLAFASMDATVSVKPPQSCGLYRHPNNSSAIPKATSTPLLPLLYHQNHHRRRRRRRGRRRRRLILSQVCFVAVAGEADKQRGENEGLEKI